MCEAEYNQLIGNIEELIEAHHRLNSGLEDVRRSQPRQQRLGQVFLQVQWKYVNNIIFCYSLNKYVSTARECGQPT